MSIVASAVERDRLRIAIQKSGRLSEPARALLERTRAIGEAKYLEFLNEH